MDATSSDVEVVFYETRKTVRSSAEQKADIWHRWKAGESLHEMVVSSIRTMARFISCYLSFS